MAGQTLDEAEIRNRREVLAAFVTCQHYDHDGIDCPMVKELEAVLEKKDEHRKSD